MINKSVVEFRGVNDWKCLTDVAKRAWTFRIVGCSHGVVF